jgi:hypothetical protein
MKVRNLAAWPPQSGGFYMPSYRVPTTEQAIVKDVGKSHHNWVTFTCSFDGNDNTYDFEAPDLTYAKHLKSILERNIGKTLFEIGNMDLPAD